MKDTDLEDGEFEEQSLENDFCYRNNVAGASKSIRMGFLRKVYGLLSLQLSLTTLMAAVMIMTPQIKTMVQAAPGLIFLAFFLSLLLLFAIFLKRRESPLNLILLAAFTVVQAYTVGVIVTFYDKAVVVQAFFLTAAVVVSLTAFTFQTKRDFTNMGSILFAGLWILILGGFMHFFIGGEITHLGLAIGGAFLFSAFIVYDTQMIMKKVSPEEYILATIDLYLDIINLFLEILKILDRMNRN